MTPLAIVVLGVGQCVNWGVLYYAFAVLVMPVAAELAVPAWVVSGAFSLALLSSAALAPAVGRWADRGRGPLVMQAGGVTAAALLAAWTVVPGLWALYLAWAGLGVCMAATLYEPAFVIVGRACGDPAGRLRALAAVTLCGGLASTIFLPGTALLVGAHGWRVAVLILAALLVISTGATRLFVFRHIGSLPPHGAPSARLVVDDAPASAPVQMIATGFALASLVSAGFVANLVPALGERGASPEGAAMLGGLMGLMQLPGRALLMSGAAFGSPARLMAICLFLHATGLVAVALGPSMLVVAAGTMTFALGAGMTTVLRPHLVHALAGSGGGYLNGRIARRQQLARAAGPLAIAWLGGLVGYAVVFVAIAVATVLVAAAAQRSLGGSRVVVAGPDFKRNAVGHQRSEA